MNKLLAVVALLVLTGSGACRAAMHSDDWCADAVDFAMRTAEYRGLGRSHDVMQKDLHQQAIVFQQQYPALSEKDMSALIDDAFDKKWTHFTAAEAISHSCMAAPVPRPKHASLLSEGHTDEWCANAVDYAMFTAENRSVGYTPAMITKSVAQNGYYYHQFFPKLSAADLDELADAVYAGRWSRFTAARSVSLNCHVASK